LLVLIGAMELLGAALVDTATLAWCPVVCAKSDAWEAAPIVGAVRVAVAVGELVLVGLAAVWLPADVDEVPLPADVDEVLLPVEPCEPDVVGAAAGRVKPGWLAWVDGVGLPVGAWPVGAGLPALVWAVAA
jgi:hypothetical protein